ncbi:MAG: hypothetical protein BJG00_010115 [Limnothrix sp. CACIAM 69d]|nr:hypothetical protein [Limnothrix sp. FACHB-1083]MBD2191715.1 hypothetical protein [Limnothrix sp. FACHB-1088]MBD2553941.1 hypothetical protein [Limnothrix sp. FACHB-708]MBD2590963.1 hypothetical protein [Limnothrix sp. FACHB-406]MBD2635560.1 hypothetical protein [Limnothrix sp. FACHB-881]OCQ98676.1 hypothetical protein BCR12_02555 [Limnothrix sp. P13C2]PIB14685.1 hypothetical protein AMR42_04840 [Limnothrix sp. PR1529]RFP59069.1 MAG: hypothetical protein BJG00_010115 [Limnothrix sp. CACIA
MGDRAASPRPEREKVELSIRLDPDLLDRVNHLTDDPSKIIEAAVRQWLRGGPAREDDLSRLLPRNPVVPPRGEWND